MPSVLALRDCTRTKLYVTGYSYERAYEAAQDWLRENVTADAFLRLEGEESACCSAMADRTGPGQSVWTWTVVPVKASIGRTCPTPDNYNDV